MAYLYRHIRLDKNEPFYIGISSSNSYKRAYSIHKRNKHWNNIVSRTKYIVEIVFNDLTWEETCEKEKEFISLYGRKDLGTGILCNMTDGGEGTLGQIISNEARVKRSVNAKGRINSLETRRKISASKLGIKRPQYVIDKISKSLKSRYTKEKNHWYGKKMSEEQKVKISVSKLGCYGPNTGKKMSVETKLKLSQSVKYMPNIRKVMVIDITTGIIFSSISDAAESYNLNPGSLHKWLNNKRKNKTNLRLI
jgi:group I intron endonuclease